MAPKSSSNPVSKGSFKLLIHPYGSMVVDYLTFLKAIPSMVVGKADFN
jgi:hypothetical protein